MFNERQCQIHCQFECNDASPTKQTPCKKHTASRQTVAACLRVLKKPSTLDRPTVFGVRPASSCIAWKGHKAERDFR
jgi:hypothetical protein